MLQDSRISIVVGPFDMAKSADEDDDKAAAASSAAQQAQAKDFVLLPPKFKCLSFDVQAQQQSNWCWLAVAASVDDFYESGTSATQCGLANTMLGQSNCCSSPSSSTCNQPGDTSLALQQVGHFQSNTNGSMTFSQVKLEIGFAEDPIVVRIKWGSASVGHAVILAGYITDSEGEQWLLVKDPSGGTTALWTYDEFRTAYKGNGTWDITRRTKN
ncbi:MAG: papain-like cysteine protease family protein [Acidimicrobiales bacterium]